MTSIISPDAAIRPRRRRRFSPRSAAVRAGKGRTAPSDGLCRALSLRYENWSEPKAVAQLAPGEAALVEGAIAEASVIFARKRQLLVALEDDAGDSLTLRFFHFTEKMRKDLAPGRRLLVYGQPRMGRGGAMEMAHPKMRTPRPAEAEADDDSLTPRLSGGWKIFAAPAAPPDRQGAGSRRLFRNHSRRSF